MRSGKSQATHISITLELVMEELTARIQEARKQGGPSRGGEQSRGDDDVSAEAVRHRKKRKASIIEDHIDHRGHVASAEDGRNRRHSNARSPKEQFLTRRRNEIVLFCTISAVAIAIIWWLVLAPEPEGALIALPEVFDPRYVSALESPATEELEVRIASLTENMGVLSGLITDLESKLIVTDKLEVRIATLTENMGTLSNLTSDLEARQTEAERLEARIASMTGDLQLLSSLTTDLESRQKAAQASVDSIARAEKIVISRAKPELPKVAEKPREKIVISRVKPELPKVAEKPPEKILISRVKPELPKVAEKPRGIETQPASAPSPVDPEPVTVARTSGDGPWTINLISSTDKAYAARFADRANSIGISTTMQEVSVKGTLYWRVQITGFSTRAEARVYSDTAKDKLGLKDTWIMQR
jgi:hypothetical protein